MQRLIEIQERVEAGITGLAEGRFSEDKKVIAGSKTAFSQLVEIANPMIAAKEGEEEIYIMGKVLVISVAGLIGRIKGHYRTPGDNVFPEIVDDFLFGGKDNGLAKIRSLDSAQAINDLQNLSRVVSSRGQLEDIAIVKSVIPLVLVTEFTKGGKRVSGTLLGPFKKPVAIVTEDRAECQLETPSEVKISDGRIEDNPILTFKEAAIVFNRVDNHIVQTSGGMQNTKIAALLEVVSGIMIIGGFFFFMIPRLRLLSLPVSILGCLLVYNRYWSRWARNFFGSTEVQMLGTANLGFQFFGSLS